MRQFFKSPTGLLLWPIIGALIVVATSFISCQVADNDPFILSIVVLISIVLMVFSKIDDKKGLRAACAATIATIFAVIPLTIKLPGWLAIMIGSVSGLLFCFLLAKSWEIAKDDILYQEEERPWFWRWLTLIMIQIASVGIISYQTLNNRQDMFAVWVLETVILIVGIIVWIQLSARYREAEAPSGLADQDD